MPGFCFPTSVPAPRRYLDSIISPGRIRHRNQHVRHAVRHKPSMCPKETNLETRVPKEPKPARELDTSEPFIEPEQLQNELRNTQLAFIFTSIATAVSGGPIIAGWSAIYFLVGRENDVPFWLCSLATLVCSALTDAFIWNFTNVHYSTGIIPYLLFASGTTISAVVDFDEFFRNQIPSGVSGGNLEQSGNATEEKQKEGPLRTTDDLGAWDKALSRKLDEKD